jgi:F-type H+-transporting ATPase subunit delta
MSAVSEQYAVALFELSLERDALDSTKKSFESFIKAFSDDVKTFFLHPSVKEKDQIDVINNTEYQDVFKDFLKVIVTNNRMDDITAIYEDFRTFIEDQSDMMRLHVYSANRLSKEHIQDIKDTYGKKFHKTIIVETHTDPSMIGGLKIEYNGMVLNNTVDYTLKQLKSQLKT